MFELLIRLFYRNDSFCFRAFPSTDPDPAKRTILTSLCPEGQMFHFSVSTTRTLGSVNVRNWIRDRGWKAHKEKRNKTGHKQCKDGDNPIVFKLYVYK